MNPSNGRDLIICVLFSFCSDETLTPEQKLEQALAASRANKPKTVPGVPSYINTTVINPKHFQTIQQKRKLLWGKKEKEVMETSDNNID